MTTVSFHMEGNRIVGFQVKGHSGYAQEGADIVCAAVTSAVRLTECTVNEVLGLGAAVKVRDQDASVSLKLPGALGQQNEGACQALLAGLMVYLSELQEEFSEHLMVVEDE